MAAWSLVIDLGMGAPLESGLAVCRLATRVAEGCGADVGECRRTYYLALLRHIGCTAANDEFAAVIGDEMAFREGLVGLDLSSTRELLPYMIRTGMGDGPLWTQAARLMHVLSHLRSLKATSAAVCEVAQSLARRLGFDSALVADLAIVYERFDGKGFPNRISGERVSLPAQAVQLAEAVTIETMLADPSRKVDAAVAMIRDRAGKALRPELVAYFCEHAAELLAEPDGSLWDSVIALEPGPLELASGETLDEICRSMGDFVDLKSPYTVGHSDTVAGLAAEAARRTGGSEADVALLRRAGWLHDLGRVSVSVLTWGKTEPLRRDEWERIRLHAYHTERVLSRPPAFAEIGAVAAVHHERLDGGGYHRRAAGTSIPAAGRILAAADAYAGLTADRPHRAAKTASEAAKILRDHARDGQLDSSAVAAVLDAAGHPRRQRQPFVADLTAREVEVLRLVARGLSTRAIAGELVVSPRTVEHHIENIYRKIGVRTRSGAAMFAMEHSLVSR
jgi:HD-GYP domain-containing protein (c-di-GMP phosphodiesterase class II)